MVKSNDSAHESRCDIIHFISGDLWAGAEVQVFHTVTHIQKQNHLKVLVVLFCDDLLNSRLKENNIHTIVIDESKLSFIAILFHFIKILKKHKPKIIHVHAYKEHLVCQLGLWLTFSKTAVVRTFHGLHKPPKHLNVVKKIKSQLIIMLESLFLNKPELRIIAVSKALEHSLHSWYPKSKVIHIYNSIETPVIENIVTGIIREKYLIKNGTFWIGTLARLAPPKNLSMLINAADKLHQQNIDFKVSIFGTGPLYDSLNKQIEELNLKACVKLEGFCPDVYPILNAMDLFVLTSLNEGLPMSLLEAMALGTPILSTAVGGINEVIENDRTGLLVPSQDIDKFNDALLKLYNDNKLRLELAKNASIHVKKNFNIKENNKKLLKVYSDILENKN